MPELQSRLDVVVSRAAILLIIIGMMGGAAHAQNDGNLPTLHRAPDETSRASTPPNAPTVVNLLLSAHDKKNKAIGDLKQDDFMVTEDGQPQRIQQFRKAEEQPLTLGILVETTSGQRAALGEERTASRSFLEQMLRAGVDKAFLIHFDREVELLQDLTDSRAKLEQALDGLNAPQFTRTTAGGSGSPDDDDSGQQGGRGNGGQMRHFGGAQLYDAIYLASNELMQKQSGRKVMVVLSDGVDRGSKESLQSALEAAHRANTIVYSIYENSERENQGGEGNERPRGGWGVPGMGGPMGGPVGGGRRGGRGRYPQPQEERVDGKKILEQISSETGGQMFEASKKLNPDQIYAQIEDQLRNQYAVAYTPSRTEDYGDFHKLQVSSKRKDTVVLAPAGYYATP